MRRPATPGSAASAGPGDPRTEQVEGSAGPRACPLPGAPIAPSQVVADPVHCPVPCCTASSEARAACRRERTRLEANKLAAARLFELFDNPVLAHREYNRYVRDLNASIRLHNSVCKPYPIRPVST